MAIAEAKARRFHSALATVSSINSMDARVSALTGIAQQQLRAGEQDAGRKTLAKARIFAHWPSRHMDDAMAPSDFHFGFLNGIVQIEGESGALESAFHLTDEIPSSSRWHSIALKAIAAVQATRGDIAGALATAGKITSQFEKDDALQHIVVAVAAKDIAAAQTLAETIRAPFYRGLALLSIAVAEHKKHNEQHARKIFQQVLRLSAHVKDAESVANLKPSLLSQMAVAQTQLGIENDARAWIASLPKGAERACALIGLSRGLRKRGQSIALEGYSDDEGPIPGTLRLFTGQSTAQESSLLTRLHEYKTRWTKLVRPGQWHGNTFCGHLILFGSSWLNEPGARFIQAVHTDRSGLATIYQAKQGAIISGRIAPDGQLLAFTVRASRADPTQVWLLDVHGSSRKLADNATAVAWSPHGKRLLCYRLKANSYENVLVNVSTGKETVLPLSDMDVVEDWSPDGKRLAVMALHRDKSFHHATKGVYPLRKIYLFSLADGRREDLKSDPLWDNTWPQFSPNGRQLAYHQRSHKDGKVFYDAAIYDLRSNRSRVIFSFHKTYHDYVHYKTNGLPCWSPDGKQIAWIVPFLHTWAEPMKMGIVIVRTTDGSAQKVDLYDRGIGFASAIDWR